MKQHLFVTVVSQGVLKEQCLLLSSVFGPHLLIMVNELSAPWLAVEKLSQVVSRCLHHSFQTSLRRAGDEANELTRLLKH